MLYSIYCCIGRLQRARSLAQILAEALTYTAHGLPAPK